MELMAINPPKSSMSRGPAQSEPAARAICAMAGAGWRTPVRRQCPPESAQFWIKAIPAEADNGSLRCVSYAKVDHAQDLIPVVRPENEGMAVQARNARVKASFERAGMLCVTQFYVEMFREFEQTAFKR